MGAETEKAISGKYCRSTAPGLSADYFQLLFNKRKLLCQNK
jgi:hypothetical protein